MQPEFCDNARNLVVCVRFEKLLVVVVFAIIFQVIPPSVEYSHCVTVPLLPDKVIVPEFIPVHTAVEVDERVHHIVAVTTLITAVSE